MNTLCKVVVLGSLEKARTLTPLTFTTLHPLFLSVKYLATSLLIELGSCSTVVIGVLDAFPQCLGVTGTSLAALLSSTSLTNVWRNLSASTSFEIAIKTVDRKDVDSSATNDLIRVNLASGVMLSSRASVIRIVSLSQRLRFLIDSKASQAGFPMEEVRSYMLVSIKYW